MIEGETLTKCQSRYLCKPYNQISVRKKIMKGKCLDAACGAGYGTYLLSENHNADVIGFDIEESAVLWASKAYAGNKNLYFEVKTSMLPSTKKRPSKLLLHLKL